MTPREDPKPLPAPVHRRTLLKSAWAAPVVLAAVAAPMAAATVPVAVILQTFLVPNGPNPGDFGRVVVIQVVNGPGAVPFELQGFQSPAWVAIASGTTDGSGNWSNLYSLASLSSYSQLRGKVTVGAADYYSAQEPI